jgi:hypothetical protein
VARDWRERAVSPERAVECVRPGARVFVGSACATPRVLLGALEAVAVPRRWRQTDADSYQASS